MLVWLRLLRTNFGAEFRLVDCLLLPYHLWIIKLQSDNLRKSMLNVIQSFTVDIADWRVLLVILNI